MDHVHSLNIHTPKKSKFSKQIGSWMRLFLSISFAFPHPFQPLAFCGFAFQCFALIEKPVNPSSQGFPQNVPTHTFGQ